MPFVSSPSLQLTAALAVAGLVASASLPAQSPVTPAVLTVAPISVAYGPYNAHILQGGLGLTKELHGKEPLAAAQRGWSMSLWFKSNEPTQTALVAGVGRPWETSPRYLSLKDGKPAFWAGGAGAGHELEGPRALPPGEWHSLAVSVDDAGTTHLIADGAEVASGSLALGPASSVLAMAPTEGSSWPGSGAAAKHFGGLLAQVSLRPVPLGADAVAALASAPTGLDNLPFEEGSRPWPFQTQGPAGMVTQQDPSLLPHSAAPSSVAKAVPPDTGTDTATDGGNTLILRHGWELADAGEVRLSDPAEALARAYRMHAVPAVVPGTVLTTLIARGVYPDPDFGLNNMAIPESLAKHSFWYFNNFMPPAAMRGRRLTLTFHGINYKATIFLNGSRVGEILGAFRHKQFDVTELVKPGESNALAVYIEPPFHTGIAHEQSLAAGAGDNGGVMMLDGPTFGATEGWDWIPGIRDRNMGIWQDVALTASGAVQIAVPQIVTHVPDTSKAEITVRVPLANDTKVPVSGTVEIAFDEVHISKAVTVAPGGTMVELAPKQFPQLNIARPKLWWPNGYGAPELHTMKLSFRVGDKVSDTRQDRFGIREITYELSAFDSAGHVRRIEDAPTVSALIGSGAAILQTHEGFRETPEGWVPSIAPGMEDSPALKPDADLKMGTALVIKVNGVRIAIKGGAWGMDDMLKRVSRERLEPYFRLHREANVNMIRNWMGQDTEDVFFDLADEYGLLVWSDFWESTQGWNLEPDDATLFLDNARDVIARYRNHPSIAVWCGRNEGVPPPTINRGLAKLTTELDGTRYYSADSNRINLHDSGPYKYQEPEDYFTKLSLGFAVEVGLASPPTLEAFQSFLPKEDQWPISDAWAYHDWHQGGNGATEPFVAAMNEEFGPATSLADFDRKAQMLNYEGHRAVFEGFNAHLWKPNSGRLLWMTQPAWPSSVWQIFSHDYDTHASYYGVKKASEPVHVQMNLPAHDVSVINNTLAPLAGVTVTARVFDTRSKLVEEGTATLTAAANAETLAFGMDLQSALETAGTVLIKLELKDAAGKLLSDNFYWLAASKSAYRRMNEMPAATLTASATLSAATGTEERATVTLTNPGDGAAIATKLTLKDSATGDRILPAYYSDNYVSLLPGETKTISIAIPAGAAKPAMKVELRGWNVTPATTPVAP